MKVDAVATLSNKLDLQSCPHCSIDPPELFREWGIATTDRAGNRTRHWIVYKCVACGGLVTASADSLGGAVRECYPAVK